MRLRAVLFTGMGIGYVLGTKAGRQRYEQIKRGWQLVRRSDQAQQLGAQAKDASSKAAHVVEAKASAGVQKVSDRIKHRNGRRPESVEPVWPA